MAALAGCGAAAPGPVSRSETLPAVPNAGWDAWVAAYRGRARARGVPEAVLDAAFRRSGYLPGVIERDRNQTEFRRTLEDYLAIAASEERVRLGRQEYRQRSGLLSQIETRYGVEARVVTAIWGLESFYGTRRGDIPVISALSTLAYDGRRGAFFEDQLDAALRILANGDVTPARMTGSWAGAMGHTQFIPTSYLAYAVDFTGDGRRDIWAEDPSDGLASAANYLARAGWRRGMPWGVEVILPQGYSGPTGRGTRRAASAWAASGLRSATGGSLPDLGAAALLTPAGPTGPAFLVSRNFDVILRYNNAESYAIGIGHLSDRIAGGGPVRGTFPPDRFGLSKDDRIALQRGLTRAGFDTQGADGVIGPNTEAAIRAWQQARGLPVTGTPSRALLAALP
jgi:lytic murein transglycosylase